MQHMIIDPSTAECYVSNAPSATPTYGDLVILESAHAWTTRTASKFTSRHRADIDAIIEGHRAGDVDANIVRRLQIEWSKK